MARVLLTTAMVLLVAGQAAGADVSSYGRTAADLSQYVHHVWRKGDGLPQETVAAVLQTRDGYIWLGTQEGLVRFDGVVFTLFNKANTPAFTHNDVFALAEGPDGSLWIGTFGGLLRLQGGRISAHPTGQGREREAITCLAIGLDGAIWVGTQDGGVNRLHHGRYEFFSPDTGLPGSAVEDLAVDRLGRIWAATLTGLGVYQDGRWQTPPAAGKLPSQVIHSIQPAVDGSLWVGTARGLTRIVGPSVNRPPGVAALGEVAIRAVFEDRHGAIWAGTDAGTLWRIDQSHASRHLLAPEAAGNRIDAIAQDREDNIWVGTYMTGLHRIWQGRFSSLTMNQGLPGASLRVIRQTRNGDVWLTTEGDGIARFDGQTVTTYTTSQGLPENVSRALFEDSHGTIWAGTRNGLARFEGGRFVTLGHTRGLIVRALAEDMSGTIWVGGRDQVYRLVGDRLVDTAEDGRTKLSAGTTRVMHRDRYGAMWIGTNVALTRWFEGQARVFTAEHGLPPDPIYCIHEDADGTLWLGSYGGGITRMRDGRFARFRQADGLFDDVAYHILEDAQGNLWISCNNGVYRVSKADLNAFAAGTIARIPSTAYDAGDGALSGECNGNAAPAGWKTLDGRLWFPTTTGALIVDPANVRKNDRPPLVVIESVVANRTPVDSSTDARLEPGTSQVTFTYTALSFIAPHKLRFQYLLEGLESEWVDAGSRRQNTYSNLAPGRYTFRVRAANNDGVWSAADARFVFVLRPRFYQTLWFRALLVLAVVGLVGAGFRLRMWRLVLRERELTAHVEQALSRIKVLSGLIPICASCKNIRDDQGYWSQLEQYLKTHSEARFSHGICPDCMTKLYPEYAGHEPPDKGPA